MTQLNKNQPATAKKDHWNKRTNKILEDHGEWLLVDISTPKFPDATMAVDTDVFEAHEWGRIFADKGFKDKYIYGKYRSSKKNKRFHRDVIYAGDLDIDHITHGSMTFIDNRRSNLRAITHSQNIMNGSVRSNNKSGITGVCWHKSKNKWQSQIKVNGKMKYLGLFDNLEDATNARKSAEEKYHGEYAFNAEDC